MNRELGTLKREDYKLAQRFCIEGMHFAWYAKGPFLQLIGWLFFRVGLNRATQVIAIYDDDRFAGVLMAAMRGEPRVCPCWWMTALTGLTEGAARLVSLVTGLWTERRGDPNEEMLAEYQISHDPDGEIVFLAADPHSAVKGVGSALLAELERREPGKLVYLYTDSGCTYQFYDKRGFTRFCERSNPDDLDGDGNPIRHFLYSKRISTATRTGA